MTEQEQMIADIQADLDRWNKEGPWIKAHSHIGTLLLEVAALKAAALHQSTPA